MVGIRSFPFLGWPTFRCKLLVSGSVDILSIPKSPKPFGFLWLSRISSPVLCIPVTWLTKDHPRECGKATETYNLQLRNPKFTKKHHPSYKKKHPNSITNTSYQASISTTGVNVTLRSSFWRNVGTSWELMITSSGACCFTFFRWQKHMRTLTLWVGFGWMNWFKPFGGGGGFKGVWWIQTDLVFWMDEFFFFSGDH